MNYVFFFWDEAPICARNSHHFPAAVLVSTFISSLPMQDQLHIALTQCCEVALQGGGPESKPQNK